MSRLIDAESLKRKAQKESTQAWKMQLKANVDIVLNQFIDWIDEAPTVGGWISVDDELPDAAGLGVLVNAVNRFGQDSIFIAFQGYGDFKWYTMDATKMTGDKDNSVNEAWKITHWMPILPPKEEA